MFTQADRPAGRGRELQASAVKRRALELGLAVLQPPDFKSAAAQELLRQLDLDAFVVVAYGLILAPAVLAVPRLGCLNIHASLLPRWRGAAPIQRAIQAGDAVTGVTIMRMDAGLDTGPMLQTTRVAISAEDTAETLEQRLAATGAAMIVESLDRLAAGAAREQPQPTEGITYAAKIGKAEARIDWSCDAAAIARKVRAFNPRPVAETRWQGQQLRIWDAEVATAAELAHRDAAAPALPGTVLGTSRAGVAVACGQGVLLLTCVQAAGKKPVDAHSFAHGQRLTGASLASA